MNNVIPRTRLENHVAWQTARTPIQPSPLRYITLYHHSVWVPSLIGRIIHRLRSSPEFHLSDDAQRLVSQSLHAERVAGLIGNEDSPSTAYAVEENGYLLDLSIEDELSTAEDNAILMPVVEFRRELMAPDRLLPWLRRALEVSATEQYLLMVMDSPTIGPNGLASAASAIANWISLSHPSGVRGNGCVIRGSAIS